MNSAATTYVWGEYEITKEETGYRGGLEWMLWHGKTRVTSGRTLRALKRCAELRAGIPTGSVKWERGRERVEVVGG